MTWKSGIALNTMMEITASMSGMMNSSRSDSLASSRTAMMTAPTAVMGASTIMVRPVMTSICTCCTSFVLRVMSDGTPSALT